LIGRLIVALAAATLLAGCYRGPGAEATWLGEGSLYPLGVVTPEPGTSPEPTVSGVFPAATPDDPYCCWAGPEATFSIRVPPGARTLLIAVLTPDIAPFQARQQGVSVAVDGGPARRLGAFPTGYKRLRIPIAPAPVARVVRVVMTADFAFTPALIKLNGDTRQLSYYFRSIVAR
jgi:hypothetical protein